jgi:hypothetical protein
LYYIIGTIWITSGGPCSTRAQLAQPSSQLSQPERVPETKPRETARESQPPSSRLSQPETVPKMEPSTGIQAERDRKREPSTALPA